jgi:prophage regulatory protein
MASQVNPDDVLFRLPRVRQVTGLSRSTIYLLVSRGQFPPPVRLSERAVGWPASAVHGWVQERISQGRKAA